MQTSLFALALALACGHACATSPQEETILKAPMPHQAYSGGTAVMVHRARLEGYFEGKQGNAAALAELKQLVQKCTRDLAASGRQLHPPTTWPDFMMLHREDTYSAANRTIRYTSDVSYGVNYGDCSLLAPIVSKAQLVSSKGVCKIDITSKTARGDCDLTGHADAAVAQRAPAQPPAELLKRLAANPAMAAALPQINKARGYVGVRGGERTILGVRCNVWVQPVDEQGTKATLCYATGGKFTPQQAMDQDGMGGLLLESLTPQGFQLKAVDARLDTEVGNAVFAPYAHGFAINAGGAP